MSRRRFHGCVLMSEVWCSPRVRSRHCPLIPIDHFLADGSPMNFEGHPLRLCVFLWTPRLVDYPPPLLVPLSVFFHEQADGTASSSRRAAQRSAVFCGPISPGFDFPGRSRRSLRSRSGRRCFRTVVLHVYPPTYPAPSSSRCRLE